MRRYTVFGQVVSGMDVVDRLQQWDTIDADSRVGRRQLDRPVDPKSDPIRQ